jgi:signal transduction histidine kinase
LKQLLHITTFLFLTLGIATMRFEINAPFSNTWWFMILIALTIAGLIYLSHRFRIRSLLEIEKMRRRIASDLHDDMGSTLSTINILSEMAKMKVKNDSEKTKEYIDKISDNNTRMMEAMDDIVWSINPMNDSMQKVAARMREFATGVFEAKDIDYRFCIDEAIHELRLDMEARRNIFLLFKEAVNNLAKYSQCSHAEIDIKLEKNLLKMRIQDDGIGFNMLEAEGGNGLLNMKKRAQSLKGLIDIRSGLNMGTTVILKAPVS